MDLAGSILLFLGEGNFSFSAALSSSSTFSSLSCQLVATDYVPELKDELAAESGVGNDTSSDKLDKRTSFNVKLLKDNVKSLKSLGHIVLLDVDATRLHDHDDILNLLKHSTTVNIFVIFNFPHVKSKKMKIGLNRDLLRDFFISCDKLAHCLNDNYSKIDPNCIEDTCVSVNVIPFVSLCAGQSGIAEVESVSRGWGDSWQINDMAAHGNFVCTSVCKFTDWQLFSIICSALGSAASNDFKPSYQSSYYRLQTGVSFTTENALTLTYQHKDHVDPHKTDRLNSIIKKFSSQSANQVVSDFIGEFGLVYSEDVVACIENQDCYQHQRPYHHVVHCQKDIKKIHNYLKKSGESKQFKETVEVIENQILVKTKDDINIIVGILNHTEEDEQTMMLYVDQLLELKYACDYRLLLSSDTFTGRKSLYPHTHEFHISFWVNNENGTTEDNFKRQTFSTNSFLKVLLNVYGLMLKTLEFVEEYIDDKQKRKSLCWKIQVQSLDSALSRLISHQMYLQLRKELNERLNIEVR